MRHSKLAAIAIGFGLIVTHAPEARAADRNIGCVNTAQAGDNDSVGQSLLTYCGYVDDNNVLSIEVKNRQTQYYWFTAFFGNWWDDEIYDLTLPVKISNNRVKSEGQIYNTVINFPKINKNSSAIFKTNITLAASGTYDIVIGHIYPTGKVPPAELWGKVDSFIHGYYSRKAMKNNDVYHTQRNSIQIPTTILTATVPSINIFQTNITKNIEDKVLGGTPKAFYFSNTPIPAMDIKGDIYEIKNPGTMIFIPQVNNKNTVTSNYTRFELLQDFGPDGQSGQNRCESANWFTPNDDRNNLSKIKQFAEVYTPAEGWNMLGSPDIAINANYFDTRSQANVDVANPQVALAFNEWKDHKCSSALGIYYSNRNSNPINFGQRNYTNYGNKNLAGSANYVLDNGQLVALDTFFIFRGSSSINNFSLTVNDPLPSGKVGNSFSLLNSTLATNKALAQASSLETYPGTYLGVSGTALIPPTASSLSGTSEPDQGTAATTRIAIGFDPIKGRLIIFQGGRYGSASIGGSKVYTGDGITRAQLADIMRAMGATQAIELDGGGSAAVVIKNQPAISPNLVWVGDAAPASACPNTGAWCSPITQPDGTPRPIPSWMGISFQPTVPY